MSNSERLTELLGEAYNSAGAGAAQFAKTQESLQSKTNNLKTAWTQFTTSVLDSKLLKGVVDTLTLLLNIVNALTDALGPLSGAAKIAAISFTLIGGGQKIEKLFSGKLASGLVKAGELFRTGKINGEEYQAGFESGRTTTETAGSGKRSIKQIAEARIKGAQLGIEEATAREKADEQIHEMMEAWGVPREVAEAEQKGKIKGLSEERAKQEAMGSLEGLSLPRQLAVAYQQGKMSGGSWVKGFQAALNTFKASAVFAPFVAIFSTLAIGAVFAAVAYFTSEAYKLKKQVKQFKQELEDIQSQKEEYNSEISSLENKKTTEGLTVQEQKRLEVLEEQTKELEKQEKIKKRQIFENEVKQKESNLSTTTYSTQRVRGQEISTPTTTYYEDYDSYIVALQEDIANAEKEIRGLGGSDADQEQVDKLKAKIEGWKNDLSDVYQLFFNNLDVLNDDELKTMFSAGYSSGVDSETLLGLGAGDAYQQLLQLRDAGNLSAISINNLAQSNKELKLYLDATGISASELAKELNNISKESKNEIKVEGYKKAAEQLKEVKKSVGAIGDAITGLMKNGYVDVEKLSTIANDTAFSGLESFGNFLDVLSSADPSKIKQVEAATATLVDEYMSSEDVLSNLNESNKGLYESTLRNLGVDNAETVVLDKLKQVRARNYVATLDSIQINNLLMTSNENITTSLIELAGQYNTTEKALRIYLAKQIIASKTGLNTVTSRMELEKLVKSLDIAADAYAEYSYWISRGDTYTARAAKSTISPENAAMLKGYAENAYAKAGQLMDGYLDKLANTTSKIDATKIAGYPSSKSSNTKKEIQKLSELYNAKKKLAAIDEKINDLEEKDNILQDYDSMLANERELIAAQKEKQDILRDLINQNEALRKQKLAEATSAWKNFYNVDETTHELQLTKTYYEAIKKGFKTAAKYSADTLNNFKKWAEEYEDIVEFSREQENSINSINSKLLETWYNYRSDYVDLVNQLAELYEQAQQKIINDQKDAYDKLKEQDDNYLDELRKNIDARRKARDRENDVEEIVKKQKRLAMLMRDSSGRNAGEITDLQKEIQDAQQDVIDEDIDRVIDSMEEANSKQQENWDNVIDKLQKQLDQDKENGKFIRLAEQKFEEGPEAVMEQFRVFFQTTGPYSQAEIDQKLKEVLDKLDNAFEYYNGNNPAENPGGTGNKNYTPIKYLDPNGNVQQGYISSEGKTYKDRGLTERVDEGSIVPNAAGTDAWKLVGGTGVKVTDQLTDAQKRILGIGTGGQGTSSSNTNTNTTTSRAKVANTGGRGVNLRSGPGQNYKKVGAYSDGTTVTVLDESNSAWWKVKVGNATGYMASQYLKKYLNGGLVDFTGPAWVDGSKSAPEAFLNAQDTRNFAQLKDILASLLRADRFKANEVTTARGGDCTIYVTVDQIASDYDVDEAVARIKQEIMSGSAYRNINLVNRHR